MVTRVMCKYAVSKGHAHLKKLDAEITSEVILEVNPSRSSYYVMT